MGLEYAPGAGFEVLETHGSVRESYDIKSGFSGSVTLDCPYANRWDLVNLVLGQPWPHIHADAAQAVSASIVPVPGAFVSDDSGQACYYERAEVTVSYSSEVKDLISESLEPTAEFITQDYKRFRWGAANGDPLLEGEAPGRLVRGLNLVRTHYRIPAIPAAVLTCVGKVNNAAYHSNLLNLDFAEETLLFQPPNTSRVIKTDGTEGWTITMKFSYKPETWNKFWRAKTQANSKIFLAAGGEYKNYTPGSFAGLLS